MSFVPEANQVVVYMGGFFCDSDAFRSLRMSNQEVPSPRGKISAGLYLVQLGSEGVPVGELSVTGVECDSLP